MRQLLPSGYAPLLADLESRLRAAQVKAAVSVMVLTCSLTHAQDAAPTLRVAPNSRHLQWSDSTRSFIQSDTAWTLWRDSTREEVAKYLESRPALKFNTIQMSAAIFGTPGVYALIGEAFTDGDFAEPVAAYFDDTACTMSTQHTIRAGLCHQTIGVTALAKVNVKDSDDTRFAGVWNSLSS